MIEGLKFRVPSAQIETWLNLRLEEHRTALQDARTKRDEWTAKAEAFGKVDDYEAKRHDKGVDALSVKCDKLVAYLEFLVPEEVYELPTTDLSCLIGQRPGEYDPFD